MKSGQGFFTVCRENFMESFKIIRSAATIERSNPIWTFPSILALETNSPNYAIYDISGQLVRRGNITIACCSLLIPDLVSIESFQSLMQKRNSRQ
jgi:hypothetical protein